MAHPKTSSRRLASAASRFLRSGRSRAIRSLAGSVLSQKHGKGSRK